MVKSNYNEADLLLAIKAFQRGDFESRRAAAIAYNVPLKTMIRRIDGTTSRRDTIANSLKLTMAEESVIVNHILDLDSRGFAPKLEAVRDMANFLLKARSNNAVGINWPSKFVNRRPELKTRFSRRYDYKRAKCEDPVVISAWFDLIATTIAQYGVADADIYNFDETGFSMGRITRHLVVTASERRNNPKKIQPGNTNWSTAIACVNSEGYCVPPFLIFAGKQHQSSWFSSEIPSDWLIGISPKGWTNNELGLRWLQHFDKHTKHRRLGTYRLLIIDGHESHESLEFKQYCKDNNIVPLCMPAHSSHYLQPLDVGCFGPLKKAYSSQIERLILSHINHITKVEFLPAFCAAWSNAMTQSNIRGAFRGSGIVPLDSSAVLTKLEMYNRTPSPEFVLPSSQEWAPKTPTNAIELTHQTELIKSRMLNLPGSSPISVLNLVNQLQRGSDAITAGIVLLREEVRTLQQANEQLSERRKRRKNGISTNNVLSVEEGLDLIENSAIVDQIRREEGVGERATDGRSTTSRRCGICRETGHRRETCQMRQISATIP